MIDAGLLILAALSLVFVGIGISETVAADHGDQQ